MSETRTMPAPDLDPVWPTTDVWDAERRAFVRMLPALLATHRGRYVAIHGGNVVAEGTDQIEVAKRAYAQIGYVPVYVGLVTDEAPRMVRVASPLLGWFKPTHCPSCGARRPHKFEGRASDNLNAIKYYCPACRHTYDTGVRVSANSE